MADDAGIRARWGKRLAGLLKDDKALHKRIAAARRVIKRHQPRRITGISANGVAMVARFEGFRSYVYLDAVGVPTCGYGETRADIIARVRRNGITEQEARALLRDRLNRDYMPAVLALNPPTQNAADALGSIAYNCGPGCLSSTGTIGRNMLAKNYRAAADGFLLWVRAGGHVLPGLVTRRRLERQMFLKGL